ncbi:hypothetical protein [Demequina phytophila]|uniref:hypothetical protein n=1 Tax=Demequina phytophila TaxID=1638981 RepID=UPI0007807254|nr:hypothetical protein [Demequina phytophila]
MRGVAAFVTGVAMAAVMALSLPWQLEECADVCGMAQERLNWISVGAILIYAAIPLALLTAILTWTLGVRSASPHEAAVRAALGEAAHAGTMRAGLTGLRDGLAVGAAAYAIAGAIHVALETTRGWEPFSTDHLFWALRAIEALLIALSLALAHVLSAWRPAKTPVERLREDVAAMRPVRVGRRAAWIGGAGAIAAGVVVGLAWGGGTEPAFIATNAAGIAWAVAWVACIAFGLAVILPWARGTAPRFVALAAALAEGAGAPRLAAVLAARASSPTQATGRTVLAVGGIAFALAALLTAPTGVVQSDRIVLTMSVAPDAGDLRDRIAAVDGVERVVVGDALTTVDDARTIVAVDPTDLRGIDDALADALEAHPDAVVANTTNVLDVTTASFRPDGVVPLADGWYAYAAAGASESPPLGTAYVVYAEEGADKVAIDRAVGGIPSDASWSSSTSTAGAQEVPAGYVWAGIVLALILTPVAAGAVKAGSREAATLAALGVEPRILRWALVVEGAVVGSVAVAAGMSAGVLTRMTMSMVGAARHSLTGVITDSYPGLALSSVPWGYAVWWGALILGVFTAVTAIAAAAAHLDTPAEALREGAAR